MVCVCVRMYVFVRLVRVSVCTCVFGVDVNEDVVVVVGGAEKGESKQIT